MPKILIVEDEPNMVAGLRDNFEYEGYGVITAPDGVAGLERALAEAPDLVILDVMMPRMSGLDVCKQLKAERPSIPIIMLTARGQEVDKVVGLELGADDYVTKPFSPREIVARVRAVLRRVEAARSGDSLIRVGDAITLDVPRMETVVDGRRVELTATEFQLLVHMARQPGRVFTRAQLLDAVHGVAVESYERAIDAHVKNIRRKIEPDPRAPRHLQTVFGVGYRLVEAPS